MAGSSGYSCRHASVQKLVIRVQDARVHRRIRKQGLDSPRFRGTFNNQRRKFVRERSCPIRLAMARRRGTRLIDGGMDGSHDDIQQPYVAIERTNGIANPSNEGLPLGAWRHLVGFFGSSRRRSAPCCSDDSSARAPASQYGSCGTTSSNSLNRSSSDFRTFGHATGKSRTGCICA